MNARRLHFSLVQFLASLALVTASAFAGEPSAMNVFVSPSQPVRLSSDSVTETARFRMMINFRPSQSQPPRGSTHPGSIIVTMADGSTRVLQATDARLIVDRDGNVVEIQADMVDTRSPYSWSVQILPYIEQDNLYSFFLTDGRVRIEFDAVAHLLPVMPTDRFAADGCVPDAGDVFRPKPPERFGHIDGDAANADGMWGVRFSPADHRRYYADHEPVLTDFASDGFLRLAFPMTEIRTGSDQIRQASIVQAMVDVSINVIIYAGRPVASPACMSLVRDGNVFAVWLTVGYFEVVEDTTGTPRLRFFALVDRSQP
jgi:hypothetical protein